MTEQKQYSIGNARFTREEVEQMRDKEGNQIFQFLTGSPGFFKNLCTRAILKPDDCEKPVVGKTLWGALARADQKRLDVVAPHSVVRFE